MTNDIMRQDHVRTGEAASRRARRKECVGAWRRRRLAFDSLETRRLLSSNVAEFPIRVQGGTPEGIASGAGSDKNVWFTLSSNNIGMINPTNTTAPIAEYAIPTYNSGPGPIAAGPDGNYWFFEENAGQFGFINPSSGLITEIPLLSLHLPQVEGITAGPNGYLWFTVSSSSDIGSINTANDQITLFPTPYPGSDPYGIVEGPDGNIWFTEAGANQIGVINPTTHAIQEFPIDSSGNDKAEGITVGPDGNLWITLTGTDTIAVMSPTGALLHEYTVPVANAEPNSITIGPSGKGLWFTEAGTDRIASISTTGTVTEFYTNDYDGDSFGITSIPGGDLWFVTTNIDQVYSMLAAAPNTITPYSYKATAADGATGIVSDSNGNLWFTQDSDNQVGEFSPTTGITTEIDSPSEDSGPLGIALGGDGNLYYAESGDEFFDEGSKIGVIDPSTGTVTDYTTQTANSDPWGIVYDSLGGDLWFTEESVDKIGRFDPKTHAMNDFLIPTANSDPKAITVDPSGNIWFTESNATQIGFLSPNNPNNIQSYPVNHTPEGIVADSSGNIWVSEYNGSYFLDEINPSNGALIKQYAVPSGHGAGALTIGPDGDIWFVDPDGNIGTLTSSGTFQFDPTPFAGPVALTSGTDGNIWFTGNGTYNNNLNAYAPNVIGVVTLTSASSPTQLAVTTEPPGSVTATNGFGMEVTVENSAGNLDIDYAGTVTVAIDNDPGDDTLEGTLTATVNHGVAIFSGLTLKVPDIGYTIMATATGLTSATTDGFNVTRGATQLIVTTEPPSSVQAGTDFSITVSAEDGLGNVDTTYNQAITLTLGNANGATLSGVLVVGASDGVAVFNGLSLNLPGNDYKILESASMLNSGTSNGFDVTSGQATQLVVETGGAPPSSLVAGQTFGLTIEAEDQNGYEATSFNGPVTLAINNNSNVDLQGNLTVNASSGLATFSGLSIDTNGSFTIGATDAADKLNSATTGVINVSPGPAVSLVVAPANEPPSTIAAGGTFGFIVDAVDGFGNIDPTYNKTVSLVTSPAVTLHGSPTATAQSGVATFSGLSIDTAGTYTIQASSVSLVAGTTSSITVTPGNLSSLIFTSQPPSSILAGGAFGLAVGGADQFGNPVSTLTSTSTVVVSLVNSAGATLNGTLSESPSGGIATFSGLSINIKGNYQIQAASVGLTSATSSQINVRPGGAYQVAFQPEPTSAIAGTAISPITVDVEDASGNLVTTDNSTVTLTLNGGKFADGSTTKTAMASDGIATFSGLKIDVAGPYTLTATDPSLQPGTSSTFAIYPSVATSLVMTSSLVSPDAAGTMGTVTVTAYDTYHNPVNSGPDQYMGTVNITSTDSKTSGLPSSYTFVGGDNGSRTFINVALGTVGTQTITATDSANNTLTASLTFTVVPGAPSQLVIITPPYTAVTAGHPLTDPIVIAEEDVDQNVVTTDNTSTVSAALTSGSVGTLYGTAKVQVVAGMASFGFLEDDRAGTLALQFQTGSLSVTSKTTTVSPGAAMVLIAKPPGGIVAGTAFGIEIDAQDGYGNTATSFSGPVNVALASGSNGTLTGTTTVPAVAGVAMFNNLVETASGSVAFTGTSGTLTAANTGNVTVNPGAVSYFGVTTNFPSSDVAGTSGSVTVTAYDANGNPVNSGPNLYEGTVVLTKSDHKTTGLPLSYTFVAGDDGSHPFSNIVLKTAGTQTISATDSLKGSITGHGTIKVVAAAPFQVVFGQQPTNTVAGTAISPPVTAEVEDQYSNVVLTDSSNVTLTLSSGTFEGGLNSTTAAASSGIATFDALKIDIVGNYTVTATDAALASSGASNSFTISPAAAFQLVWGQQPTDSIAGLTISPAMTVIVEDKYTNVVTTDTSTVTLTLSGAKFSTGTTTATATASSGIATFGTLEIDVAGAYTLAPSNARLPSNEPSKGFTISPAAASQLVLSGYPSPTTAGVAHDFTVTAEDPYGNTATAYTGTVHFTSSDSQATVGAGLPSNYTFTAGTGGDDGKHSFTATLETAKTQSISATDTLNNTIAGTQSGILVVAAAATQLVVTTPPPNPLPAGQAFNMVVVAEDQFGNVVSSYNQNVSIALPGLDTMVKAVNGVATFTGLSVGASAQGGAIQVTAGGLKPPIIPPIKIAPSSVPPTIILEQPATSQKLKKGKKVGKPAFSGFEIEFSTTMSSSAGSKGSYQLFSTVTKKGKKNTAPSFKPVGFTTSYNPATNMVTLNVKSATPFAKGGEIKISGVTDQSGTALNTSDTILTILAKAKRVILG